VTDERSTGREAQMSNITAAVNVAETVRSTLGPAGMDKCLIDERGETIITNDGVTILRELDTAHPGATMMVEASKTQEAACRDGTTSVVVLAGQMLALSEGLLRRGIHPRTIIRSFNMASETALQNLPDAHEVDSALVASTALRGKAAESHLELAAGLVVDVADSVDGDMDRVRVITQNGGSMADSYVHKGLVLSKGFSAPEVEHDPEGMVLMLNGGLEGFNLQDIQMQFTDPGQLQAIQQQEMTMLGGIVQRILDLGVGILFARDGVHEAIVKALAAHGVGVVSRLQESDMLALTRITGHPVYHRLEDIEGDITTTDTKVEQTRIGDLDYVTVEAKDADVVTLVIRGATRQTLDEYERAFDDALGVTCLYMQDGGAYPGGGAVLSKVAGVVREKATTISGISARERMCLEAFADSLEIVPAAIAANAGMDPLDVVMELRSCPDDWGLYIDEDGIGEVMATGEKGIYEPVSLVRQIITSATEVSTSILRIDDIIAKRAS
jgi:chaperonin GroEL (HSP60 family)